MDPSVFHAPASARILSADDATCAAGGNPRLSNRLSTESTVSVRRSRASRRPSRTAPRMTLTLVTYSVRIFQLVAKDTVEDRVLEIQAKKEALIAQVRSMHAHS